MPWPKHEAARLGGRDDLVPLPGREVVAGRVVAAGMQHDDRAGRGHVQRGQHAVEVDPAARRDVVRIGLDGEAGVGEQRAVVLPARVADQHLGAGVQAAQEVRAELEAAGAAECLHGGDAAGLDDGAVGPKYEGLDRSVVRGDAVDGKVAARLRCFHHLALGALHALQQGELARIVVVHADAQVDLVRVGVGVERLGQAQDRVAGSHLDGLEQRHAGNPLEVGGRGPRAVPVMRYAVRLPAILVRRLPPTPEKHARRHRSPSRAEKRRVHQLS
jgi:hypothetical protein